MSIELNHEEGGVAATITNPNTSVYATFTPP